MPWRNRPYLEEGRAVILDLADNGNDKEVRAFFEQFSLKGMLDIRPSRPQGFFRPYQVHSDDWATYLLRDDHGEIHGMASFVFRKSLLGDRIRRVAWATDLRVSPQRRPMLDWSQNFLPVIREIYEKHQVETIFSVINRSDPAQQNVFLRPRSAKRTWPRYHLYRKFDLVTLHGRFPWAQPKLAHIRIQRAEQSMKVDLIAYLQSRSQYRPFASVWDSESFDERLRRMPGMKLEDFFVAFDTKDQIIGCAGSWSAEAIQEFRPLSYGLRAHNFRQFLKFGKYLGWTRPLTKPVRSTGFEAPLHFRYLIYPFATNEDVFDSLLTTVFENVNSDEFLMYARPEQDFRRNPPRGWIASAMPYSLYCLVPPEMPTPDFLDPRNKENPEIEAFLSI